MMDATRREWVCMADAPECEVVPEAAVCAEYITADSPDSLACAARWIGAVASGPDAFDCPRAGC